MSLTSQRFLVFAFTITALAVWPAGSQADEGNEPPRATLTAEEESASGKAASEGNPVVVVKTSMGDLKLRLFEDKSPISVANFLSYVDEKFYDGTVFHRVIDGFMIQGGGFDTSFAKKQTKPPIKNEAGNGLTNARGTVAMARTNIVDSATSQFFINVADNAFLNHMNDTPRGFGYAVFGEVFEGMETVDKIKAVKTGRNGPFTSDCPLETVTILSIRRVAK
jgi:cyclophilin family peptidyl-prolyl cis-trans isomerase